MGHFWGGTKAKTRGNGGHPGVRSTHANDSQLFAQTFFILGTLGAHYAKSIWRRPEMKMARTIRSIYFCYLVIVLFSTSFLQLINFVTLNLHYKSSKIQCNYVCGKEIIPYACPLANTSEVCSPKVANVRQRWRRTTRSTWNCWWTCVTVGNVCASGTHPWPLVLMRLALPAYVPFPAVVDTTDCRSDSCLAEAADAVVSCCSRSSYSSYGGHRWLGLEWLEYGLEQVPASH